MTLMVMRTLAKHGTVTTVYEIGICVNLFIDFDVLHGLAGNGKRVLCANWSLV